MARTRKILRTLCWQWAIACALLLAACASPRPRHSKAAPPAASPSSTASERATAFTIYQVKPGDTLSNIAARYQVSVAALASWNGISDPNLIKVNTPLRVPGPGSLPPPGPPPVGAPPPPHNAAEVFARPSPEDMPGVTFPSEAPAGEGRSEVRGTTTTTNDEPAPHRVALARPQKPGFSFSPELLARARGETRARRRALCGGRF